MSAPFHPVYQQVLVGWQENDKDAEAMAAALTKDDGSIHVRYVRGEPVSEEELIAQFLDDEGVAKVA